MASGGKSDTLQDTEELLFVSRQDGDVTKYGGWKLELLVEEIVSVSEQKLLLCTLCKGLLRDACVITLLPGGKKQVRCQTCTPTSIVSDNNKIDIIRSVVDDRMIYCPFLNDSCKWTGPTVSSQTHLKECLYFFVPCPLSCFTSNGLELSRTVQRIQRKLLQDHLTNKCPMREIQCEYCQEEIQASSVNSHLTSCEEFPIQCKNGCTFETIYGETFITTRKAMRTHLQYDCPLQQVACPYAQHGCDTKVVRKNVLCHKVEFMGKHLELVESCLKETKISLAKQIDENMVLLTKKLSLSNGGVEWRVLSVKSKMIRNKAFHSPPIYSCGYKFRFSIQYNNQEHLGVYLYLMKGENDEKLKWRFKGEVTFILHGPNHNLKGTISSEDNTTQGWVNKPTINHDPSLCGFPHFVSHEDLSTEYITDDSILLQVFLKCI